MRPRNAQRRPVARGGAAELRGDLSVIDTDRTSPADAAVVAWRQLVAGMEDLAEVVDAWRDGCVPMTVAVVEVARRARALESIVLAAEVVEVSS